MAHGRSPRHAPRKAARRRPSPADDTPTSGPVRVQKILATAGFASRRGAEELIRDGRVTVNGKRIEIGASADPAVDVVAFDGERIRMEKPSYWILHKPAGVVTTLVDPHGRRTVRDLIPPTAGRLHPVGRLDRDSSGLLLLTNDGALTQRLLHPTHESEKEYRVTVRGEIEPKVFDKLRKGVHLEDGPSAPTRVEKVRYEKDQGNTTFHLVLTEGRKRQIRRMMLMLGHPVRKLMRVRVGPIVLGRLMPGAARPLRADEVRALRSYVEKLKPSRRGRAAAHRKRAGSRA